MVSIKSFAAVALAAIPSASAYLTGLTAPESATAGETITATFSTAIYNQNWSDYAIIWGLGEATVDCGSDICIGQQFDYTTVYPDSPTGNYDVKITVPSTVTAGDYKLWAAIPYLVGASGLVDTRAFSANITITA
ncbi:hypothetical protein BX600DRAFT_207092 [Xylariales sp. PMI_506]|nr:hypothetical protein BX600DRAFT_207092 [Xylariales sp. PMI_506]